MRSEDTVISAFPSNDEDDEATLTVLAGIEDGRVDASRADGPRLAALLAHPRKAMRRRASGALAAAVARGCVALEFCESLLTAGDEATRWGAAFALEASGHRSPAVVEAAFAALGSDDGDVRWAAASIVIAEARASKELGAGLRRLARSGTPTMRKMAILCLGDGGETEGAALLEALGDVDAMVRVAALTAIARGGDRALSTQAAVAAVAEHDSEARVRRAAAAVLRRLQSSS